MRILIIRYSSLGDVVLATGPVLTLLTSFKDAEITFVTKPMYEPLLRELSPRLTIPILHREHPLLSAWRALRGQSYDWIIDLHGSLRSVALTHILKSRRQTRVQKNTQRRHAMVKRKAGLDHPISTLQVYHDALAPLGITDTVSIPKLALSRQEQSLVESLRSVHPTTLALGWGARWPTKAIPKEKWGDILSRIPIETIRRVVVFGEPKDGAAMEGFLTEARSSTSERTFDMVASDDWRNVLVNLAACRAYIGSDSGLMHVADAIGVPTIGLFGPTHPALGFPPSGPQSHAVHAGTWCSPCHRHGAAPCFRGHRYCFDEIDTGYVAGLLTSTPMTRQENP